MLAEWALLRDKHRLVIPRSYIFDKKTVCCVPVDRAQSVRTTMTSGVSPKPTRCATPAHTREAGHITLQALHLTTSSPAGQVLRDKERRAAYDGLQRDGLSFKTGAERWRPGEDDFDDFFADWFRRQGCECLTLPAWLELTAESCVLGLPTCLCPLRPPVLRIWPSCLPVPAAGYKRWYSPRAFGTPCLPVPAAFTPLRRACQNVGLHEPRPGPTARLPCWSLPERLVCVASEWQRAAPWCPDLAPPHVCPVARVRMQPPVRTGSAPLRRTSSARRRARRSAWPPRLPGRLPRLTRAPTLCGPYAVHPFALPGCLFGPSLCPFTLLTDLDSWPCCADRCGHCGSTYHTPSSAVCWR